MSKRTFRTPSETRPREPAVYPTLDEFDRSSRRGFLARLCTAALGAGTLAVAAGCGSRSVNTAPDSGTPPTPRHPTPLPRDGSVPEPDEWTLSGGARAEDARIEDWRQNKPDAKELEGDVAGPDARIDQVDSGLEPHPGFAPTMDARVDDSGSCPNP
jgi:hypothetical protein